MAFRAKDGWPECGSEQSRSAVQRAVQSSSLPQMAKRVSLAATHVFQPEPGNYHGRCPIPHQFFTLVWRASSRGI